MRRCWFCVFETPSLITSLDVLTACICSLSPDEVFTIPTESAWLSLDSMRPSPVSPVSCNMTHHTEEIEDHTLVSGSDTKGRPTCHCDQCGQVDPDFLTLSQLSSTLDPTTFARDIISSINIADVGGSMITQRHSAITPERVSEVFGSVLRWQNRPLE